jgi:hypothetical protein
MHAHSRALSPISLGGNANGMQLLGPDTIDLIFQEQADGIDLVLAMPLRWVYRLCTAQAGGHTHHSGRKDLLLGRLGRLCGGDESGPPHNVRLRDEQRWDS